MIDHTITQEGFSFHTFEMSKSITRDEYQQIKDSIFDFAKEEKHRAFSEGNCLISEKYKPYGIIIKLFNNSDKPPHLQLRVNPRLACAEKSYVGIFHCTEENIETVKAVINRILTDMNTGYDFNGMTVSRIDLCVNLEMDQYYLDAYMRLICKCKLPESYRRIGFIRDEPDFKEKNKRSFRAANKDVQFTIYDKKFQVAEEGLFYFDMPVENGLIRFEVSLKRDAIYRNNEYFRLQFADNSNFLWVYGMLSRKIIEKYICKFFPKGIYASYERTKAAVRNASFPNKTKVLMLDLLKATSEHESLFNAIRDVKFMYPKPNKFDLKLNRILKNFERLNYNPVTTLGETLPGIRELLGFTDGINQEGRSKFDVHSAGLQTENVEN